MYNYIIVHDTETQATISININHIEEISKRDSGSLIVTDIGHRLKVKESVSEVARKIAFITERS
jgi:uncharacterized protein YlzI (FlbEa/FlbD family)